jgi:hypothetical protein
MARGFDTSRDPRRDQSGALHQAIARERANQEFFFGTELGPKDDGMRTKARPAPVGGDFEGAHPNAIRLGTMVANRNDAMAALMQPADIRKPHAQPMVDLGMSGRLSDGVERPVRTYVDERIKQA